MKSHIFTGKVNNKLHLYSLHVCLVLQVTASLKTQSSYQICLEHTMTLRSGLTHTASDQVLYSACPPFTWLCSSQIKTLLSLSLSLFLSLRAISGRRRRLHQGADSFRRRGPALPGGVCCKNGALSVHCIPAERFPVRLS